MFVQGLLLALPNQAIVLSSHCNPPSISLLRRGLSAVKSPEIGCINDDCSNHELLGVHTSIAQSTSLVFRLFLRNGRSGCSFRCSHSTIHLSLLSFLQVSPPIMPSVNDTSKPKVLALGYPSYAGDSFMQSFESSFRIDVVEPTTRARTVADLAAKVASSGPYDALLVRMGIGPYEPFDKELLQPLVPHCKILVSASAGYNEFDVEWMTENGMWFCNTRSAVSEATADMAIFLILSILKDASRAEKSARSGLWRADHSPTTDPSGLTLGIVGLGGIGRVRAPIAYTPARC